MHLCVLLGSKNKQRLFLYTALTYRQRVFTAPYKLGLQLTRLQFRPKSYSEISKMAGARINITLEVEELLEFE
jgi:hypothetical protein